MKLKSIVKSYIIPKSKQHLYTETLANNIDTIEELFHDYNLFFDTQLVVHNGGSKAAAIGACINNKRILLLYSSENNNIYLELHNADYVTNISNKLGISSLRIELCNLNQYPKELSELQAIIKSPLFAPFLSGSSNFNPAHYIAEVPFSNDLSQDVFEIITNTSETERKRIIAARLGQGSYRDSLIRFWSGCSITQSQNFSMLVASHIKPWCCSNSNERLDVYNGLLLTPNLDRAFDSGLITFTGDGKILISKYFGDHENFNINLDMRIKNIANEHIKYLNFHRNNIFKT